MAERENTQAARRPYEGKALHGVSERLPGDPAPRGYRAFVRLQREQVLAMVLKVYVVVMVIIQTLLLYVAGETIDLYISSVELWAELAEKHLRITL